MTLQEVTEGRDDAEGQEVSPLRLIHHSAGLPSPAEPFRATSSHAGNYEQWNLHSVGSKDSILLSMISLQEKRGDPARWFTAETDITVLVFVEYNLESSPELQSILTESDIS